MFADFGLGILLWAAAAVAQATGTPQPPAPPPSAMQMTIQGVSLTASDGNIYVNQNCGIFPDLPLPLVPGKRPTPRFDPAVCHLEGIANSQHREEKAAGLELERSNVDVHEQEYVLQNITAKPTVFVVLMDLPQGWKVDSDPQPVSIQDNLAVFHAHAEPGEIVRLHVGIRRTKDLKPKPLAPGGP